MSLEKNFCLKDLTWETRQLWRLHQLQKSLTNNLAATYVEIKEISIQYLIFQNNLLRLIGFLHFQSRREINYMLLRILVTKTRPKIVERFSQALLYSLNRLRVWAQQYGNIFAVLNNLAKSNAYQRAES